ncbi:DUF664 domain-containing protein [Streptomyces sp. NPDC058892]|uniref:mycothiol transferase n=1 Tax=unclassified Streptomyces TaxID=2593676 RepID=UPI00368CDFD5
MTQSRTEAWPEPPLAATEAATVLRATLGPSTVTLGGLLKRLAHTEDSHFARLWLGSPVGLPWDTLDWDDNPDWDYRSAAEDTPEQLHALWQEAVDRSRAIVDKALTTGGLDQLGAYTTRSGARSNLRRILLDLIEEYARHAVHADLIRESVDGLTGEDPPR